MMASRGATASLGNPLKPLPLCFLAFQDAWVLSTAQKYLPFYLPLGRSPGRGLHIYRELRTFWGLGVCKVLNGRGKKIWNIWKRNKNEFEEYRYWNECPSLGVMCWVLYLTWIPKEFDIVELYNPLVCRPDGQSSWHQKALIDLNQ